MKKFNTTPAGDRVRHLLLIALLVLVAGCSSLRLSYNHGETLLYWWLNAYVDLEADQKGWVKKDIDELFHWHRKTQLKDYVQVLGNAQRQLQGNITQADLLATYDDIKNRAKSVLVKAEPELADLARSLRPEQVAQIEQKFAKNNEEYRKKFLRGDTAKRQKVRYQKAMEQFELWFGSFSHEQEEQIKHASDIRPLNNELWLEERMLRQRNVINLIQKVQREKLGKEATVALIHKLIQDGFERLERSEHKAFFDAYNESTAAMVLTAVKVATPAQKAHALKRMQGWVDDFNSLAAEAR